MTKEKVMFSIRMSKDMRDRLDAIAEKEEKSRNELCSKILSDYVKYQEMLEESFEKYKKEKSNKNLDEIAVKAGLLIAQQVEDKTWLKTKITQILTALMADDYDNVCINTIMLTSVCNNPYCSEILCEVTDNYKDNKKHLHKMLITAINENE